MKNNKISTVAGYYYLGLAIGLINKENLISWADHCIDKYRVPYAFVELSLSANKSIEEILTLLKVIYNKFELRTPLSIILYDIRLKYINNEIQIDDFFSYLSSLLTQASAIGEDEELLSLIDHFDDRYYLAKQGIYGDIEEVIALALEEFLVFEEAYTVYIKRFEEE